VNDDLPIACSLSDSELRKREATILAQFKGAATKTEECDDGYSFALAGHRQNLALVFELLAAERECCPFLKFQLETEPANGPLHLRITGPGDAKAFLTSLFG